MRLFNTVPGVILVVTSLLVGSVSPTSPVDPGKEFNLPVIEGWTHVTPGDDYPYQLVNLTLGAEILLFKSEIPKESVIGSEEELRESVRNVTNDVVLGFPDAQLLTSAGYFENSRVRFVIEFLSIDTTSNLSIWHRLAGYVYRHPAGHQLLFTVWGKCAAEDTALVTDDIKYAQSGFVYTGPAEEAVFAKEGSDLWWSLGALFLVLLALFFILKRYQRNGKIRFSEDGHFWRCPCGRLNHDSLDCCRRCGTPNRQKILT
ncbi:MAG: hypothetical protein OEW00_07775 [candidate division Zixibacteria bacterium]|nr:hypothetical protein [candidate division Zixibacteria bacterium]